jgi:hypothetical protein
MLFWHRHRKEAIRRGSLHAQRTVEDDPRWTRAIEPHLTAPSLMYPSESGNKRKGRCHILWGLCLFTAALLAGCALFAPREEAQLKQATVKELTALLTQREAAIQTMKGLFSAKVRGGIIPIASRLEGTLYYRRPNAMRLRGFSAVGSELFEFVQANDHFRLRLPTIGRILSGDPSDMSEMGKLARPFQLSVWAMGGVLGTSTIAKDETVVLVEEGDRYRLEVSGPSRNGTQLMRRLLWFERQTFLVVREDRLMESGAVEATIQYEDFRPIGQADGTSSTGDRQLLRPFKIVLEDGKGQGSVQLTFHEMIPNQPLSATDLGQV